MSFLASQSHWWVHGNEAHAPIEPLHMADSTCAHGRQYWCILWPCLTLQIFSDPLSQWPISFIISSQDSEQFCNVRHGCRILECSLNFATVQCVHERASYPCNRKTGRSGWHRLWCIGEGARQCLSAPLPCNSTWHFIFYEDSFLCPFSQYLMWINCTYHSALYVDSTYKDVMCWKVIFELLSSWG